MSTTTATTTPPSDTGPGGLTLRQRVSRPSIETSVQERIRALHGEGVRQFTPEHFADLSRVLSRPESWITDHLIILEGLGVLRPVDHGSRRAWTLNQDAGYLR